VLDTKQVCATTFRIILDTEVVGLAIGEQTEDSILRWSTMLYTGEYDAGRAEALS
jgi:hypothetical protein